MLNKGKVLLIGGVAVFAGLLDTFFSVQAQVTNSSVSSDSSNSRAPLPVRFPLHEQIFFVKPVARNPNSPPVSSVSTPYDPAATLMMREMNKLLREKWARHRGKHERVIVYLHLLRDGSISKTQIMKSSRNKETDDEAVQVLREIGPRLKQPFYFDQEGTDIQVTFHDAMFNPLDSNPESERDMQTQKSENIP
ncbi:MAG TPA: energy transducer TonB [Drouetiella sp.]|jgi:TonB family protein